AASLAAPALPRRVPNTAPGIARLVAALAALAPALVVLEATGRYHRPLLTALVAAGVPTAVANPAQVAAFRQAGLGREKSDRADAALLARFAELHGAELRRAEPADPLQERLRELVAYRDDLVAERTRLKNRLHATTFGGDPAVAAWLAADLAQVEARLREVERETDRLLADLPEAAVLRDLPGVGPRVVAAVLAYLPRAIWGDPKAAAAYAGVHPRREQSGQRDRAHLSKQGHAGLRRYLYMAATVALAHDPTLAAFRDRLVGRGKHPASAKCAAMHKLLRRMMGRLRAFYQHQTAPPLPLAA
ncbi:MAG: transposase, partial [Dactylosporangium sp.]|nr:transposase [Dactylosporangium sp.]